MTFWDTSAIVPLLVRESETARRETDLRADGPPVVWWGTRLECVSALALLEREDSISPASLTEAHARLEALAALWRVVRPADLVLVRAERLLRIHPLRAADALQLAAALVAVSEDPRGSTFLTSDARLATAASREGFRVA